MRTVNIHEAKTRLSELVDGAVRGEAFIIAKAGKPLVKVMALGAPTGGGQRKRLGFMKGQGKVSADFDTIGQAEIESLFAGDA